ncbi:hypothetical protein NLJ89_g4575 [Agrocybe chaxingu]|uniref:Uncharacterized protein n=1 Tax=Agrocybe chaxingu TaxID=84603 RepID=A0A9W8K1U7_9AGAR|nr:hypothetical protein NLJ89_g4575 [Agrocybe chaxingu]
MSSGRPPITTRWMILDDSDERIQYAGPWLDVDGAPFDNVGNFGPTYGGRMRATVASNATVSLTFNGGTVAPRGEPGIPQRVRWECLIDGEPHLGSGTLSNNAGDTALNNFVICEIDRLSQGEHTLSLNVTRNEDQFYVDRIGYGTANGTFLSGGRVIQATFVMPRLPSSTYADQPDSSVSFSFNGSSIAGEVQQLDTEAPVNFDIPGNFTTPQFFLKYFQTPECLARAHRLTVRYTGIPGAMPLALSHFEVTDSRLPVRTSTLPIISSTSSVSPTTSPTQTALSSLPDEKKSRVGPIVGGGIAFICILGFIVWYLLRRQNALRLKNPFRSTLLMEQVKGRRDSRFPASSPTAQSLLMR